MRTAEGPRVTLAHLRDEMRALLAELDVVVPQPPDSYADRPFSLSGPAWNPAPRWRVIVPTDEPSQALYVGTPDSIAGDVIPLLPATARAIAAALLGAAAYAESELTRSNTNRLRLTKEGNP